MAMQKVHEDNLGVVKGVWGGGGISVWQPLPEQIEMCISGQTIVDFRALATYFLGKINVMIVRYYAKFSGQKHSALPMKFGGVNVGV